MDPEVLGRILADLAPLSRKFNDAGHRLYLVGGVVRDLVRGATPEAGDDIDLTTDAAPATTQELVAPMASALWTQGERFGTIGARVAGRAVEITTHRAETYVESSRKPEVAFGTDVVVDLSRRDFTINAMALELPDGSLIDPYGGARDLAERRLRTPLDPLVSFSDDPLRMLRAARFIARFGLEPVPELQAVATSSAPRLRIVSVERVHDELERLLATTDPVPGIRFLITTGLLAQVLPSAVAAGARPDACFGGRSRLDVVLAVLPRLSSVPARRALLLWPVLVDEGVAGVDAITRRLRYSSADQLEARRLTAALGQVLTGPGDAAPVVRRLTGELGDLAPALWSLLRALAAESTDEPLRAWLAGLPRTSRELDERGELGRLDPPLDGRAVMRHLGCGPGPVIGEALDVLRRVIVDRGPLDEAEARAILDRWWAQRSA